MSFFVDSSPSVGAPGDVHSTQKMELGSRRTDNLGAEYIYLRGVSGTAIGSWVVYDEDYFTILLDTDLVDQGDVAIASAAVDATTEYGWYCIKAASVQGLALTALGDNAIVFATSTGGSIDDADTGVGYVHGALSRSVVNETTFLAEFQISYPFVTGADLPN